LPKIQDIVADEQAKQKLWDLCQSFVKDQKVSCSECVWQSDRVIENAYELIDKMCKLVGFFKDPDDEEEEE